MENQDLHNLWCVIYSRRLVLAEGVWCWIWTSSGFACLLVESEHNGFRDQRVKKLDVEIGWQSKMMSYCTMLPSCWQADAIQ